MRRTMMALLAVVTLAAACGTEGATGRAFASAFRYSYTPGGELLYATTTGMDMILDIDSGVPELDGRMTMEMAMHGLLEYGFAEGPDPDTVEITITQDIIDLSGSMAAPGFSEQLENDDIPDVPEVVLLLDAQGNVIDFLVGGQALPPGLLGDPSAFGPGGLGTGPPHAFPAFPDRPLSVGESWDTQITQEVFGVALTLEGHHRVVGEEDLRGRATVVIETTLTTSEATFNLHQIVQAMTEAPVLFGESDADEIQAAMDAMVAAGVNVSYTMEPTTTTSMT
ncbi:MAG: hypothetical protein ACE5KX_02810, partial [Acidimicrobiia bacterium]